MNPVCNWLSVEESDSPIKGKAFYVECALGALFAASSLFTLYMLATCDSKMQFTATVAGALATYQIRKIGKLASLVHSLNC